MLSNLAYWPRTYIHVGGAAFILAVLLMPIAIVLLRRFGVMDTTADNKIHSRAIPRGGGMVIFIAFTVAVLWPDYRSDQMNGLLIGGALCLLVGALDDILGGIPAVFKFLTLVVVTLILANFGVRLILFPWAWLNIGVTLVWIVGVTSAFNGIDNMDGQASGVAAIVSAMFLFIAVESCLEAGTETSLSWFGMMAAGILGANLGFLVFNFKPASIFMGDSGSFFLGFMLAALGVLGEWSQNPVIASVIPILILGVPIFDFTYIIFARIITGETRTLRDIIEHCAPDHLSHRLVWIGFSQRKAVMFIYLIAFVLGSTGVLLHRSRTVMESVVGLAQGCAIVFIVIALMEAASRAHRRAVTSKLEEQPANEGKDHAE